MKTFLHIQLDFEQATDLSSLSRNLYKAQKLLSMDIDLELPIFKTSPTRGNYWTQTLENFDALPLITVILIATGAILVIYIYYRARKRPRRRHVARFKRFLSAINAKRVPSV